MNPRALARYRALLVAPRTRAAVALAIAWDRIGSYNEADVDRYVAAVTPQLVAPKAAVVSASAAFYAVILGIPPTSINPNAIDINPDLRGPFTATWHAISEGRPWPEAVKVGRSSVEAAADDFLQSTARRTGDAFAETTGRPLRWQRVAEGGACDWCLERSGTVYSSASDGDYGHNRDHCIVVPLSA